MFPIRCVYVSCSNTRGRLTRDVGTGADLATAQVAQRLVLRSRSQYCTFPLYLSIFSYLSPKILDPCGDVLSSLQSHFCLVCTCESPHRVVSDLISDAWQANYYIAFQILSQAMEDKSFHLTGINIVNIVLEYFYLGLLVICFILSLGNRPQGSKWGYTLAMVGFAVITIYMTVSIYDGRSG
jgi:hypothetical protein